MNLLSVRYSVAIFGLGKEQVKLNNQLTLSIRNIKTVIAVCTTESLNALPAHIVQRAEDEYSPDKNAPNVPSAACYK